MSEKESNIDNIFKEIIQNIIDEIISTERNVVFGVKRDGYILGLEKAQEIIKSIKNK